MYQSILSVPQGVKEGAVLLLGAALQLESVEHDGWVFLTSQLQKHRYEDRFPLAICTFNKVITPSYYGVVWPCLWVSLLDTSYPMLQTAHGFV